MEGKQEQDKAPDMSALPGDEQRKEKEKKMKDGDDKDKPFVARPWSQYPNVGRVVEGTRFISFKVPLTPDKCKNLTPSQYFTPSMLYSEVERLERTLGMAIDLANTNQFYDEKETFEAKRVKHRRIFCPGKGKIPSIDKIKKFEEYVDEFVKETEGKKDRFKQEYLIGVLSKQGINRTGYFICRYLITKKDWSADDAIAAFENARGRIERDNLVKDLYDVEEITYKQKHNKMVDKMIDLAPNALINKLPPAMKRRASERRRKRASATSTNKPRIIPAKWKKYKAMGGVVDNTRFITFKAPLDKMFFRHVPQEHWFTPELLVQEHMPSVQRTLGLVVDVTNSNDLYQPDVFKRTRIQHHKILCLPVTDKVPPKAKVDLFFQYVDTWIAETAGQVDHYNQPPLIGVHSTRGVNRAAYFVCRYLIERGGWEPNAAIEAVESARGSNIEKDAIVKFLRTLKPATPSPTQQTSKPKCRQPLNAPTSRRCEQSGSTEHESEQSSPPFAAAPPTGEKTKPAGEKTDPCKQQ